MISPIQKELLMGLEKLLELSSPDIRVGQLVDWLGFLGEDMGMRKLPEIEDRELLIVIERFRSDLEGRVTNTAETV